MKMLSGKLVLLLLTAIGLLLLHTTTAQASGSSADDDVSAQVAGCVGTSFSATLGNGKAICNGNFLVRMQGNGDLVLRRISSGRACWTSNTAGAWSHDAYAVFTQNIWSRPWVDIKSSQGKLKRIEGGHGATTFGTNASINSRGDFYIGYKKIAGASSVC